MFYVLSMEHFEVTLAVLFLMLLCCGIYIARHRETTKMSVMMYILMLLLMCLLFTVVSIRDEQNDYNQPYPEESRSCPEYDFVVHGNRIDIYERFTDL